VQGFGHFAAQSERLFVDEDEIRCKNFCGVPNNGRPDRQCLLDIDVKRQGRVLAIVEFDDAGNANKVHARPEIEAANDRRARKNDDRQTLILLNERMSDRLAAAQMAKTERIVAVDQHSGAIEPLSHRFLLNL